MKPFKRAISILALSCISLTSFAQSTIITSPAPQDNGGGQDLVAKLEEIRGLVNGMKSGFASYFGLFDENDEASANYPNPSNFRYDFAASDAGAEGIEASWPNIRDSQQQIGRIFKRIPRTVNPGTNEESTTPGAVIPEGADLTMSDLVSMLLMNNNRRTEQLQHYAKIPMRNFYVDDGANVTPLGSRQLDQDSTNTQDEQYQNTRSLSLDTLLGPLNYGEMQLRTVGNDGLANNTDYTNLAKNYIAYVTGMNNPPLVNIPDSNMTKISRNKRINKVRMFYALQSVALSNLNQMYARRLPRGGNDSVVAEEKKAFSRWMSQNFNDQYKDASPLLLQKIQTRILAEMNYQLYETRQQNERILATLSALEMLELNVFMKEDL